VFYAVLPQYIGANQDMKIDINTESITAILIAPYTQHVCSHRCWFECCTWHPP